MGFGGRGCAVKPFLLERNPHAIIPLPDDTARKLQSIIGQDQREGPLDGDRADGLRELDRRAGRGQVAHRARIFVAAVLRKSRLLNLVPRGNPGFGHVNLPGAMLRRILPGYEFFLSGQGGFR